MVRHELLLRSGAISVRHVSTGRCSRPSVFNTDFSAAKRTALGRRSFEIRIDVFNLFDKAHFANPGVGTTGGTFGTAAFGTISSTRLTSREAQLGLRLLF